eukprot:TRINITY_DN2718_c0_g1_i1.p1 TRINITY_DN2718_c0_g1~~TRINITY_DN2718_c0_g1_i1.p1  ORF type:complete len:567 (+),score=169.17 TRINITY_DN2718_c0_g1_i1:394-2094(+)
MSSQDAVYLKILVPSFRELGSKTKKYSARETIGNVIDSFNRSLPPSFQSPAFELFFNGDKLDRNKLLVDCGLGHMETVELKRDAKYEIVMYLNPNGRDTKNLWEDFNSSKRDSSNHSILTSSMQLNWDVKTKEAIKKIGDWVSYHKGLNGRLIDGSFRLKKVVGPKIKQELGDLKDFCVNDIKTKDVLQFEATPIGSSEPDVTELVVAHSPSEDYKPLFDAKRAQYTPLVSENSSESSSSGLKTSWYGLKTRKTSSDADKDQVSRPYNVVHKSHVDFNFQWSGQKPELLFELMNKIGQGAYGSVWLAKHRESSAQIAIKVVAVNDIGKAAISKEVDVLKQCKSPNVLSYYGTCSTANEVWILMDYCAVGSVKDMINRTLEPLEEAQIAHVSLGVLKGLAYLHSQKIIHLDVKAANVMVNENCEVKLGDFGVSEPIANATGTKQQNDLVGSPLYMPPEVILKAGYNSRADIWSLGITLIEMAEGRPPNNDIKSLEQLKQLPNRPPATLKHANAYSKAFNELIAKCLVKDPAQRPDAIDLLMLPFVQNAKDPEVLRGLVRICMTKIEK